MKNIAITGLLFSLLIICTDSCSTNTKLEEGKRLSETHCQSCHKLPDPQVLDKKTWANYVLPKMGNMLGFRYMELGSYYEATKKGVSLADWNKIVNYYLHEAPDVLEKSNKKIQMELKQFVINKVFFQTKNPATTYVGILPEQHLLLADGLEEQLYKLSPGGLVDSFKIGRGVVNIQVKDNIANLLAMGVLYPSDEKKGTLTLLDLQTRKASVLIDSLQRPVYIEYADLNNDSMQDVVVCEFGNNTGQLAWYENKGNSSYTKHTLRPLPGAIRTYVVDANKDGRPDIIALMAQGDEGIFIYFNKGDGRFEEKRVLQFPPSYGSNYFELDDFNKDGYPDILATNGDNGDYPPVLKPYHGIRVYLNDGQFQFKERIFLPMNGASKAMARDFDGDGDLDIASISYFPDYVHQPEESFIYWQNAGNFSFHAFSFKEASIGRWLVMDSGDIDNDGDLDLVLGNAKFPLGNVPDSIMKSWNRSAPSVLVLKNQKN